MDFQNKFEVFIRKNHLFEKGSRILLGVSGGIDSVVMLDLFHRIQPTWHLSLFIVHLNHGLRDKTADRDEVFVWSLGSKLSMPVYTKKVDVLSYTRQNRLSIEEGARILRFQFFKSTLDRLDFDCLALAHQADDQAETIVMHLVKGSGIRGLRGIQAFHGKMIHPMLFATRKEIEHYAKDRNLEWVMDETNSDRRYLRNQIRIGLLDELKKILGGSVVRTICRAGKAADEAEKFLEYEASKSILEAVIRKPGHEIILDINKFLSYFSIVQKTMLIRILEELSSSQKSLNSFKIDRILLLAQKGKSGSWIKLSDGMRVVRSRQTLVFFREPNPMLEIPVRLSERVYLENLGIKFCVSLIETGKESISFNFGKHIEYLDYDKIRNPLFIRFRKDGDRFVPFGMEKKKKLHDFFIDEKVPNYCRNRVPLLIGGDDIMYVFGFRIDDRFKVTNSTKRILKIEVKNNR